MWDSPASKSRWVWPCGRDVDLDHEAAAGLEVPGDVLEAGNLRVLGHQVADRVEHEVRERERPADVRRREVPDGDTDRLGTGLRAQPRDHRL
jgi:hypothetical protein